MKKEISKRHYQIGESIKRTLSNLFMQGKFEYKIKDLFSIIEVVPSKAFETAVVYVAAFDANQNKKLVDDLNAIASQIRYELANNSELRSTPVLIFKEDTSFDYAKKIEDILNSSEVKKDLES